MQNIIVVLILSLLFGCRESVENKLVGHWRLDGTYDHEIYTKNKHKDLLVFLDNENYTLNWMHDDVGNTFRGKYFILNNPKRALKTLCLVPNIQDSIRIAYEINDIHKLSKDSLILISETKFIHKEGNTNIYTTKYVYVR